MGSSSGTVQIWDAAKTQLVHTHEGHRQRVRLRFIISCILLPARQEDRESNCSQVCTVAWNRDMLASGSRDRLVLYRDARTTGRVTRFVGHKQEVRMHTDTSLDCK